MKKKDGQYKMGYAWKNNMFLFKLALRACPGRIIGEGVYWAAHYAVNIFWSIIFLQYLVESIEVKRDFGQVLAFVGVSLVFLCLESVYSRYFNRILLQEGNQKLYEKLHLQMFEKAADVELACYENPAFYNRYTKAASQIKSNALNVIKLVPQLICVVISSVFLIVRTLQIDPFAIVLSLFPILSTYVIGNKMNREKYELYQANVENERQKEYVKRTVYLQDYAKEIRLSNIFSVLMQRLDKAVNEIVENTKKYGFKLTVLSCLQGSINQLLVHVASIVYVTVRLVWFHNIQVSEFIVLVNAVSALAVNLVDTAKMFNQMQDNSLYIQNIKDFLDYKPQIAESQDGRSVNAPYRTYQVKDVSFSYFGQDKPVLQHINMEIKPGEKIALVGHNGAGKTTLVKLLMRLYDPTQGEILLDGRNIAEYNVRQYRKMFATVFQDFKILSMTVAENVLLRDVKKADRSKVVGALQNSGIYEKVKTFSKGIDTTLTREFDETGAVLSGGEGQKIAVARVFASDCQIAILDEPSSALDPIAEYQMYESMLKACENKAVVFISHRLSSAVLADRIYVMENGMIVEVGNHQQLMDKKGKYAEMFDMQARNYK
ncbi:MAG: ABC transporter ATP-binding protein [Lachnospiraceae bacterium]